MRGMKKFLLLGVMTAVCPPLFCGEPLAMAGQTPGAHAAYPPALPLPAAGQLVLDVRDPEILQRLEQSSDDSLSLGAVLHDASPGLGPAPKGLSANAVLDREVPVYKALTDLIRTDLASFDRHLGTPAVKENAQALRFPAGNVARQFDERWLRSEQGYFLLTGVVNRFDRKELSPSSNCGELRYIYRLAYRKPTPSGKTSASRLPFFLNLVFEYPYQADCSGLARQWQAPDMATPEAFVAWLRGAPLDKSRLRFKQIELNAQVLRFPAGMMRETGGQAAYLMRVYRLDREVAAPQLKREPLENTPDVRRLRATPALYAELVAFIRSRLEAIDAGVFQLPRKFLAMEAISFSPLGNNRLANKPFNAIFRKDELKLFSDADFGKLALVKSPAGLMERLNNATCMGCHQGGSTAGFHFFGLDRRDFSGATNQIRLGTSSHYFHDAIRRMSYLRESAQGRSPSLFNPLSYAPARPGGETTQYRDASVNEFCIVDAEADFHSAHTWKCESDALECRSLVKNPGLPIQVGQCVPRRGQEKHLFAGQACREGTLVEAKAPADTSSAPPELPFNFFSFKDGFTSQQVYDLPQDKIFTTQGYNCRPTHIGVPLGRTFRNCTAGERKLSNFSNASSSQNMPAEICGLVGGTAFDRCAAGDFHECLGDIVVRGVVDTCHQNRFCREDYMCQKLDIRLSPTSPEIARRMEEEYVGFCTPTYFLYQMRIDGHPVP